MLKQGDIVAAQTGMNGGTEACHSSANDNATCHALVGVGGFEGGELLADGIRERVGFFPFLTQFGEGRCNQESHRRAEDGHRKEVFHASHCT